MIVSRKLNTLLVVSLLAWILVVVDGEGHHPRPQRPQKRNHGNGRNGHPAPKGRTHHVETGVETTTDYVYEEEEAEVLYEEADENYDENYDYMEIPSEMQYGEEAETGMIWDSSQDMYYEAPEETDIEVPDYDDEYEMDVDCAEEAHLEPKFHAKGEPEMHAPPKTGKKSAGKGTEKSSKSKSKKGKGGCKESKKGKKSKKSKKGGGSGDPSMPSSPVDAPALPPVPVLPPTIYTPSPTHQGSVAVALSPYALSYQVSSSSVPQRKDLVPLTDVTRKYLEEFMFAEFERTTSIVLDDFITKYVTANAYPMGGTAVVEFNSTARFAEGTEMFPSRAQLDEALATAFTGDNLQEYMSRLRALPDSNIFSGSPVVEFVDPPLVVSINNISEGTRTRSAIPAIAGAAVGLLMVAAGALLYKQRYEDNGMDGKGFDDKERGDMTVAGETYAGETYDGTVSVDASSLLDYAYHSRDEEEGKKSYLGVIREFDASSVTPAYEEDSDEEEEEDEEDEEINLSNKPAEMAAKAGELRATTSLDTSDQQGVQKRNSKEWNDPEQDISIKSSPPKLMVSGQTEKISLLQEFSESSSMPHLPMEGRLLGLIPRNVVERQGSSSQSGVESLLSFDSENGQQIMRSGSKDGSSSSPRPRTVSEIEMLLSSELGTTMDELSELVEDDVSSAPSQRPRSVSEIEALLSQTVEEEESDS